MQQRHIPELPGWETLYPPIGSGSFSTVYEIVRTDELGMEEHAALKVISVPENKSDITAFRDDGLDDKSITAYFKTQVDDIAREFHLLSGMKGNSNIVSYEDHQIVQHDSDPGWDILIRMELLAPLTDYYRANFASSDAGGSTPAVEPEVIDDATITKPAAETKVIDDTTVIKIGVDLCKALELCEKRSIIHRDIKPQNIFVNKNGDFKLGDFGIARVSDHTTKATKAGTYTYMAPEVYTGKSYNARVDQYSLGLVLYWLLNERRMPFVPQGVPTAAENSKALSRRMDGEPLPEPLHGSPELKKAVLRACAFDPEARFSGPAELRAALEGAAQGRLAAWLPGTIPVGVKREKLPKAPPQPPEEPPAGSGDETIGKYDTPPKRTPPDDGGAIKICRVVFADENGRIISKREYPAGQRFEVPLLKDKEDKKFFYPFMGWSPRLTSTIASKDITYTAQYGKQKKKKRWLIPAVCAAAVIIIAAGILGTRVYRSIAGTSTSPEPSAALEDTVLTPEPSASAEPEAPELTSLELSSDALTLFPDRSSQLSASAAPRDYPLDDIKWSSSNAAVASVDKTGEVTAKRAGTATITATLDGKSATCRVTVENKKIESITLSTSGAKTEYFVGERFDETGLKATVKYNTGDEETVTSGFGCEFDFSKAGNSTVTVSYGGEKAGELSVTVKQPTVASLTISKEPNKKSYTQGDAFDPTGLALTAAYDDGSTKTVSAADITYSPKTLDSAGGQDVTISYGGKSLTFRCTVEAKLYTLTVKSGSYGSVSGGGSYKDGERVTITATPDSGCEFYEWSDGSKYPSRTVTVSASGGNTYTATFLGRKETFTDRVPSGYVEVDDPVYYYRETEKKTSTSSDIGSGWTCYKTDKSYGDWSGEKAYSSKQTVSDTVWFVRQETTKYAYYHWCYSYYDGTWKNVDSAWQNDTSHYDTMKTSTPLQPHPEPIEDQGGHKYEEYINDNRFDCDNQFVVWWRDPANDEITYYYKTRDVTTTYYYEKVTEFTSTTKQSGTDIELLKTEYTCRPKG